jgi:AraC-like DNA-binding protein
VQHIEFFDNDHFENNYFRIPPPPPLFDFIDFFWETKFDHLWKKYQKGFSDAQFSNIGYTYIINLGTPFAMQVANKKFSIKTDCFLPRYNAIECFHKPGNHLFGIKFRISPVLLEKKINFSEYKESIFPLSYLLDQQVAKMVKKAKSFDERIGIFSKHFLSILTKHKNNLQSANIVSGLLQYSFQENDFTLSLEKVAAENKISLRTLQRYFQTCTGISSKQALQIMRIRKAVTHMINSPESFDHSLYEYYDHSHLYKHIKQFLQTSTLKNADHHLKILESLHK